MVIKQSILLCYFIFIYYSSPFFKFIQGSFKCELCPPGYIGDGFTCVYIPGGVCAIDNGGCHQNAECNSKHDKTMFFCLTSHTIFIKHYL